MTAFMSDTAELITRYGTGVEVGVVLRAQVARYRLSWTP